MIMLQTEVIGNFGSRSRQNHEDQSVVTSNNQEKGNIFKKELMEPNDICFVASL